MPTERNASSQQSLYDVRPYASLSLKAQKGSKPRCHHLTHGDRDQVAKRLSQLIQPFGEVTSTNVWYPVGFHDVHEPQLCNAEGLLSLSERAEIRAWWLKHTKGNPQTPNFDIASTCCIGNQQGLLLVEAKAHSGELQKEEAGKKRPTVEASRESVENHEHIGTQIQITNAKLTQETGLHWNLSRENRYQMSNRFAHAWKVLEFGKPVILVYLGFTGCSEMKSPTSDELMDLSHWTNLVLQHSDPLFPPDVWNRSRLVYGQTFSPLIRTWDQDLCDVIT